MEKQMIRAILPTQTAHVLQLSHEWPAPDAPDSEWDQIREFIALAKDCGATGFAKEER
jgi:acetone carboxylase gamma subunit